MFKIDSDMINLIGCSKENFFELLELMHYKIALMKVITSCQEQIHEIDAKLEKEKRKSKLWLLHRRRRRN